LTDDFAPAAYTPEKLPLTVPSSSEPVGLSSFSLMVRMFSEKPIYLRIRLEYRIIKIDGQERVRKSSLPEAFRQRGVFKLNLGKRNQLSEA
jgi:hypothetical protein